MNFQVWKYAVLTMDFIRSNDLLIFSIISIIDAVVQWTLPLA